MRLPFRVLAAAEALFDGYGGRKRLRVQPGRDHNTLDVCPERPLWAEAMAFLTPAGQ